MQSGSHRNNRLSRAGGKGPGIGSRGSNPPHAERPSFSPMAPPLRKIAMLAKIENTGWARDEIDGSFERCTITATLTDGFTFVLRPEVSYRSGQRERIMEVAMDRNASPGDVLKAERALTSLRARRWKVVQDAYGEIHRLFGRGVPWHDDLAGATREEPRSAAQV